MWTDYKVFLFCDLHTHSLTGYLLKTIKPSQVSL